MGTAAEVPCRRLGVPLNRFAKRRRVLNFVGLMAGFGLGQGSLFAVQTWLLATGEIEFMGRFSFIFTMVILAYQAIDLGGLVLLARHVAAEEHASHDLPTFYWSFSAVRIVIALVLGGAGIVWLVLDPDSFESNYAAAAAAGLILLSVNPGGILDGYNMSGWAGATWALPFVASALALPFGLGLPPPTAGLMLGAALSLGGVLAVTAQYALLHRKGSAPSLRRPTVAAMRESGREALLYMSSWLPGQLYFRGQVGIAMALLGPVPTALFIYAKQVIMIATRFLVFARRVEYPNLVRQLADRRHIVRQIVSIQKVSLAMGVLGMFSFTIFGLVLDLAFPHHMHGAGLVIALFAPIILTASVYAMFMQACYAVRQTHTGAWIAVLVNVIGLGLLFVLLPFTGMTGIALVEGICHVAGAALIVRALTRRARGNAALPQATE